MDLELSSYKIKYEYYITNIVKYTKKTIKNPKSLKASAHIFEHKTHPPFPFEA